MKLKIYKYPLAIKDSQVITLPAESTVLSIKNQLRCLFYMQRSTLLAKSKAM